jgi:hypothetical protein
MDGARFFAHVQKKMRKSAAFLPVTLRYTTFMLYSMGMNANETTGNTEMKTRKLSPAQVRTLKAITKAWAERCTQERKRWGKRSTEGITDTWRVRTVNILIDAGYVELVSAHTFEGNEVVPNRFGRGWHTRRYHYTARLIRPIERAR